MIIRGYFREVSEANKAIEKLNKAGFNNAFLDANDHHNLDLNTKTDNIGSATSLSDLTLYSSGGGADEGNSPLKAASPMASGMGSINEITDINYTVNVEVDNDQEEAKNIIENMGGTLNNPHIDDLEAMNNADIDYSEIVSQLDEEDI